MEGLFSKGPCPSNFFFFSLQIAISCIFSLGRIYSRGKVKHSHHIQGVAGDYLIFKQILGFSITYNCIYQSCLFVLIGQRIFSLNQPLGRLSLYVVMPVFCMLLSPPSRTGTAWTGDFFSKSVLLKFHN